MKLDNIFVSSIFYPFYKLKVNKKKDQSKFPKANRRRLNLKLNWVQEVNGKQIPSPSIKGVNESDQEKPIEQSWAKNSSMPLFTPIMVLIRKEFEEISRDISCRYLSYLRICENFASIGDLSKKLWPKYQQYITWSDLCSNE